MVGLAAGGAAGFAAGAVVAAGLAAGAPLPFLSSNDITSFSILDSGRGTVRSYRFDTRDPNSAVVLFDEFPLA